jgi:hypothetical protein
MGGLFFWRYTRSMDWWQGKWGRLAAAALASLYFFYYAQTKLDWHFIDNVNLLIHEAGHWVFFPFGEFMHVLGGSLFQTIFPLVYVWYFFRRYDFFSASLVLFWVGQNLINVSVYAGDAVAMQLPLLGGDGTMHDWNYLLWSLHALPYTASISGAIFSLGVIVLAVASVASIYFSQAGASVAILRKQRS